ncbi:hypothetical protein [Nocardioides flavescens]|uniref:Uncharacterized protein n=1 Tax=Nocardioides flavescens TaxID=2691959 RepID=A0A6L7EUN4_9ACTN|nr:hypothetical protein [Nocardioides flavescens]MXG91217.1 hypothetical protein [Nocardioides flavescens]
MPDATPSVADRLLDAQVAYHLDRLTGDELGATVARLADAVLDAVGEHQLADLVDAEALKAVVGRGLTDVPSSAAVAGFVDLGREVLRAGPAEPFALADVVDRAQVERLVDEALALTPALERALERLTASSQVGAAASRFMGRIVGEVLAANQAVADLVPGLGGLLSFGTRAAAGVVGAADRQLDGLLADTAGKGGTLAVRRLNRIVVETLRDPTTREAALQVWDLVAAAPVRGLGEQAESDEADGLVEAGHDLAITVLADTRTVAFAHSVVDGFLEAFGGYTPTELLAELDLDRADVVADLVRFAPGVVEPLVESGALERIVRAELAPFYASAEVAELLAD